MDEILFGAGFHKDLKNKKKPLNRQFYEQLRLINLILDVIIKNTLIINKLTSIDEIMESISANPKKHNTDSEPDRVLIESICNALSVDDGVLIKLTLMDAELYKLRT